MRWLLITIVVFVITATTITALKLVTGMIWTGLMFWLLTGAYLWLRHSARRQAKQ